MGVQAGVPAGRRRTASRGGQGYPRRCPHSRPGSASAPNLRCCRHRCRRRCCRRRCAQWLWQGGRWEGSGRRTRPEGSRRGPAAIRALLVPPGCTAIRALCSPPGCTAIRASRWCTASPPPAPRRPGRAGKARMTWFHRLSSSSPGLSRLQLPVPLPLPLALPLPLPPSVAAAGMGAGWRAAVSASGAARPPPRKRKCTA